MKIRDVLISLLGLFMVGAAGVTYGSCTIPIGGVMALSGSLGSLGQAIAKSAELAVETVNRAGGVNGCDLKLDLMDDQTNPIVGVSVAKQLVDVRKVPAIIGPLSSGVTMAVLTSVAAPARVVMISPSATSPAFTSLAASGKTHGFWFRTAPSDDFQGEVMADIAYMKGLHRVAVIYLKNPYGEGLARKFRTVFRSLGQTVTNEVAYNPGESSYRSVVEKAKEHSPQALFLIGYPGDGATIAREWIAEGGVPHFLLPDGLQSQKFINDVGPQYFKLVYGTAPGSTATPSLTTFQRAYQRKYGRLPMQPYMTSAYDDVMLLALAMEQGKGDTPTIIRDNLRKVSGIQGVPVYAGVEGYQKALALIKQGKRFHYVGASGIIKFDKNGDIIGSMGLWTVKNGKIIQTGMVGVMTWPNIL